MKRCSAPAGFTLAELLVVVAILSATALAAFGLVSEDRAQVRGDDTRNRLTILRRAVLGPETPAYGGEWRLAGYVADNGRLPEHLRDLLDSVDHAPQAGVTPLLTATVDGACVQTGTGGSLGDVARVLKGHRGNYLGGLASDGRFRDGWGNEGAPGEEDALDFGWQVVLGVDASLEMTSLGADNAPGETTGAAAEADQSMKIADADWRVALDGWQVTLRNAGSDPLDAHDFGVNDFSQLGLALLVFENTGADGRWRQYRSHFNSCPAGTSTPTLEAGESCVLKFVAGSDGKIACDAPGNRIAAQAPLGRHVLTLTAGGALPPLVRRVVAQADFYPGAHPPNLVWEFRP
ncbi:MAG: type II secretion system GspH family protein [Azoarcus sp.]|jgi:prepilin-type N-terminal cleavage/methylation domain-containing protein|nr:type II secretion system GspH family protein [Azoarcus sp.]